MTACAERERELAAARLRNKLWRQRQADRGLCARCTRPAEPRRGLCAAHLAGARWRGEIGARPADVWRALAAWAAGLAAGEGRDG